MPVASETTVYLDRSQCDLFTRAGADAYFDAGEVVVAASTLLNSKGGDGYDEAHRDALAPHGSKTLVLEREETDAPGWFRIAQVI